MRGNYSIILLGPMRINILAVTPASKASSSSPAPPPSPSQKKNVQCFQILDYCIIKTLSRNTRKLFAQATKKDASASYLTGIVNKAWICCFTANIKGDKSSSIYWLVIWLQATFMKLLFLACTDEREFVASHQIQKKYASTRCTETIKTVKYSVFCTGIRCKAVCFAVYKKSTFLVLCCFVSPAALLFVLVFLWCCLTSHNQNQNFYHRTVTLFSDSSGSARASWASWAPL